MIVKKYYDFLNEDTILLRKMSYKSVVGFGKYKELTVQEIINLGHTAYLRYLYYNIEGISFVDDVLKDIGVYSDKYDYRIEKPGKNPELGDELFNIKINNMSFNNKSHFNKVNNIRKNVKNRDFKRLDNKTFSKSNLQRWNQGK